jgi:hypothetical protein
MSSGSSKRTVADTSIELNYSLEDETVKKTKMAKDLSILILDVGGRYINQPNQLKTDLDNVCIPNSIKEVKITVSKHLIIIFNDLTGHDHFINNYKKIFTIDTKIIQLNHERKKIYEIVIKGANYKYFDTYSFKLSQLGITQIKQMNKNNEDFRMIRATCKDEAIMKKLIFEGVKLDYCYYRAEEYKKPIRPIQCYKCQQFDHVAMNCNADTVCQKCAGNHLKKDCLNDKEQCANCGEEHQSSFYQCQIYKQKLEVKIDKLNSKQSTTRNYSQAAKKQEIEFEEKLQKMIIDSVKVALKSTEMLIKEEINSLKKEIVPKIEMVQNDLNIYKAKELFIEIDDYQILNNKKLSNDQIKKLIIVRKNHGIEINQQALLDYNTNRPVNKEEYKNIQYVSSNKKHLLLECKFN